MKSFKSIYTLLLGLAAVAYYCKSKDSPLRTLRGTDHDHDVIHAEQRKLSAIFNDPKTVIDKSPNPKNCQIVYILGVEGAMHHGFSTVFDTLARQQVDHETNVPYKIHRGGMEGGEKWLQSILLGIFRPHRSKRSAEDPRLVKQVMRKMCPPDGKKHIILEDSSFPFGQADFDFPRVRRDPAWSDLTMDEIASSDSALNQPTNLYKFYDTYSNYADIRFVVIHRPFLETVASHHEWDGGSIGHSNVLRGFMLLLRRFLDNHMFDVEGSKLWTLVCIERIAAKFYDSQLEVEMARQHVLSNLANFLSWPIEECPTCFDSWKESTKDYRNVLGEDLELLEDHIKTLEGVWPPVVDNAIAEQSQCQI